MKGRRGGEGMGWEEKRKETKREEKTIREKGSPDYSSTANHIYTTRKRW